MSLYGKGFYIWKIPSCEGGDPTAIATAAKNAGLGHVIIKIADGTYDYNYNTTTKADLIAPVAEALLLKGIRVWGWHYVYGDLPREEAKAAIRQIKKLPLDGYVIDAEGHYKDKYQSAKIFMNELRAVLPDYPIALSSYRYPSYHPQLPWTQFLSKCDYNFPQMYWEQAHNPDEQLIRSYNEFLLLNPVRPYVPTGAAYASGGWIPTTTDIKKFLNTVISMKLTGASFWSWDYCRLKLPEIWQAIADYKWTGTPPPQPQFYDLFINYLNDRNVAGLVNLYAENAVLVTAKKTIQGKNAINGWFTALLNTTYPTATFSLESCSGSENSKTLVWKISVAGGATISVEDTLGMLDGKIVYHYCSLQ